jgi:hypothetical protein
MSRIHRVRSLALLGFAVLALACQPPAPVVAPSQPDAAPVQTQALAGTAPVVVGNPPRPDFDLAGSDQRAIEIADRVMARLGGRNAWEQTRYLTWRFFGKRRHVWDKWTGDLRFEQADLTVLMNLHEMKGQAWRSGRAVENPDSLAAHLDGAYRAWINDSYWLVMPYKLKDSGVTLTYVGEEMTEEGLPAHVLELRFKDVGVTPQNRYRVWVDIHELLVRQWAFYREAGDSDPRFVLPWQGWTEYGRIWLAHDFGRSRHSEIGVFDQLPAGVFTDPASTNIVTGP